MKFIVHVMVYDMKIAVIAKASAPPHHYWPINISGCRLIVNYGVIKTLYFPLFKWPQIIITSAVRRRAAWLSSCSPSAPHWPPSSSSHPRVKKGQPGTRSLFKARTCAHQTFYQSLHFHMHVHVWWCALLIFITFIPRCDWKARCCWLGVTSSSSRGCGLI